MKVIQITNTYKGEVLDIVHSCVPDGFVIRTLEENSIEALEKSIEGADYLLASGRVGINAGILKKARKLKMIQRTGVGLDSLDLDAIKTYDIPLYVNKGINAQSVAEHALLLIMACMRRLVTVNNDVKNGIWQKQAQGVRTKELSGKTVGIIGMGSIGRILAGLLKAFNVNILCCSKHPISPDAAKELGVSFTDMQTVLTRSDIISLNCPLNEDTKHIICKESMNLMKDGAIIVNTARGGLICESDLIAMLKNGKISAAGLDVFESEPVDPDNELLKMENVIVTPHIGGVTYDSFYEMMFAAMNNIKLFDDGRFEEIESSRYI